MPKIFSLSLKQLREFDWGIFRIEICDWLLSLMNISFPNWNIAALGFISQFEICISNLFYSSGTALI